MCVTSAYKANAAKIMAARRPPETLVRVPELAVSVDGVALALAVALLLAEVATASVDCAG